MSALTHLVTPLNNVVTSKQRMTVGFSLTSANKKYVLALEASGKLSVHARDLKGAVLGLVSETAFMGTELFIKEDSGVMAAQSNGGPITYFGPAAPNDFTPLPVQPYWGCLQDDGHFCLRSGVPKSNIRPTGFNGVHWKITVTDYSQPWSAVDYGTNLLFTGQTLYSDQILCSNNRRFFAYVMEDGNFGVYRGPGPDKNFNAVWAANSEVDHQEPDVHSYHLLQRWQDGNLVVYGSTGHHSWASMAMLPNPDPDGLWACMQDDGLFVLRQGKPGGRISPVGVDDAYWWSGNIIVPTGTHGIALEDFSTRGRQLVLKFISSTPYVGGALSGFVGFYWKDTTDVWEMIKSHVEAAVNEKVNGVTWANAKALLDSMKDLVIGFHETLNLFATSPPDQRPTDVWTQFNTASKIISTLSAMFMSPGQEVLLMPLMTNMVTLHLTLIREAALGAATWGGCSQGEIDIVKQELKMDDIETTDIHGQTTSRPSLLGKYTAHVTHYWNQKMPPLPPGFEPSNKHESARASHILVANLAHRAINQYVRFMTVNALDARDLWPYLDPARSTQNPPALQRVVRTGPYEFFPATSANTVATTVGDKSQRLTRLSILTVGDHIDFRAVCGQAPEVPHREREILITEPIVSMTGAYTSASWNDSKRVQYPDGHGAYEERWHLESDGLSILSFGLKDGADISLDDSGVPDQANQYVAMQVQDHVLASVEQAEYGFQLCWRLDSSY